MKIIIGITFIFLAVIVVSQPKSGKINYNVTHKWTKKIAAVDYMSKSKRDHYEYVWGSHPEHQEKSVLTFTPEAYRYDEIEDQTEYVGYSWRSTEYFIFRDITNNSTYDVMRMFNKLYLIEDQIEYPQWKILNDLKEVAGHICMSASYVDTIKNNKITAWFALDWPGNIGPERFGGLPGVILEVDINNGAMIISADTIIEDANVKVEKPEHKKRIKTITEAEYRKLLVDYMEECKTEERPYFWGLRY
jgi:GLPGLI family protein